MLAFTATAGARTQQRIKDSLGVPEARTLVSGIDRPNIALVRMQERSIIARSVGGCDDALCVVALCRSCHRRYDNGALDLVAYLEPDHRAEAAHAVAHVGLAAALRRISNTRG